MPLSHGRLSAWYHQLAQQLEAGLPLATALRSTRGIGFPARGLEAMAQPLEAGRTIEAAFAAAEAWLPASERLVLAASAETARLPQTLHRLSERHAQLAAVKLRLTLACLYPLGVLHVGLLLLPLMRMIDWEKGFAWDAAGYGRSLALMFLPLWGVLVLLMVLARRQPALVARPGRLLPFVGGYLRAQGLSDFAFALGNFLEAGMRIDRAWTVAGSVATGRDLRMAAEAMGTVIDRGERPGTQLARWSCFPPDFVALYHAGESTGQLDQNLLRLAAQYQARASHALTLATFLYPALMFLVVAGAVVFNVIKIYAGYLKMIEKMA